jgi:hypothetical protein
MLYVPLQIVGIPRSNIVRRRTSEEGKMRVRERMEQRDVEERENGGRKGGKNG